ncbi:MAG TPA: P-type conjugative transfer protein TrbJ [Bryobacteraceae bacterium]|nr:P-type conjugative transfer protein TrbJ [Bryobacteraceae bacterium]
MHKRVIFLMLLAISVQKPQRAEAGAFATEVTQLLNHAQLVLQYIRQGEQLVNELNMYADMIKNSRMLSAHTFGAIMNDVNALAAIVQGGQGLAYSLANLDQRFRQTYPGYGYNAGAYYTQYRNWSQTSLDTTLGTLRAAGLQGQQLQSEQAIIASLRNSLAGTDGRLEALHALGDISEQQVEQMMKLRELMMADMSSKQAYQAAMIQRQAASEAAAERFFTYKPSQSDNKVYHAGWN